jgi:hypothetical protein
MRCLHVIDALRPTAVTSALGLLLVTRVRATGEPDLHDVLAFAGGPAEDALRGRARRVFIAGGGLDVAAVVHARAYDLIHAVDAASAHRIAPLVLGSSATPFVYSGRALSPAPDGTHGRAADESLAAAADLTVLDASGDGPEPRPDLGARVVRLDFLRSGLAATDGAPLPDPLPPRAAAVLREWLACLARATAA